MIPVARADARDSESDSDDAPLGERRRRGLRQEASSKRQRAAQRENEAQALRKKAREERVEKEVQRFARPEAAPPAPSLRGVKNRRLLRSLEADAAFQAEASESAARAAVLLTESEGFLEAEHELERTYKVTQGDLAAQVDQSTRAKQLDLRLEAQAPYRVAWSRNGRFMVMGGRKGHLAVVDGLRSEPRCEVSLSETVRDVVFLHNQNLFAAAQKKYIYIYDDAGSEVHRLRSHIRPDRLEFLPYHFLLASVGRGGWLKYQDTSTGELVSEHRTKLGPCSVMAQNPSNAIICLGHGNGCVTLWSPSAGGKALANVFCHDAPVVALAVSGSGRELVSAGLDGKVSVWDLRTYARVHSYFSPRPPGSLDVSQSGLLAVASGYQVQIWKDALRTKQQSPYMRHARPGDEVLQVRFRPFEDVLALGHSSGVQTILVPGAGTANYDAFEANPFESTKQRREKEVRSLLEKLQPDMIVLDPQQIARVDTLDPVEQRKEEEEERRKQLEAEGKLPEKRKNKMKGKNKIGSRLRVKHKNIFTAEREAMRAKLDAEARARDEAAPKEPPSEIFQRFAKKKQ